MKSILLLFAATLIAASVNAQTFQTTLKLFAKKALPYEAPSETYTDQYLEEEGEPTTIPYKPLSEELFQQISANEDCRCEAYAVDYLELKNGILGLVVYQVNQVQTMPYEELVYVLYLVNAAGKPIDNIELFSDFYSSDPSGDVFMSTGKKSTIDFGEFDDMKDRIFIEMTYESSESMMSDFGQQRTMISVEYMEIMDSGRIEDITVYLEE